MTNRAHVEQYARDRHVEHPKVFTLSAKLELEGEPHSGFPELRDYLRTAIQTGDVWRMKVEGASHTIRGVMVKLLAQLRHEKDAIAEERAFYQELLGKVQAREAKAESYRRLVVGRLAATYDKLANDAEAEFAEGLKMGNLLRRANPFGSRQHLRSWLAELRKRFHQAVRTEVETQAPKPTMGLLDELQAMRAELHQRITKREERVREDVVLPDAAQRLASLQNLRSNLENVPVAGDIAVSGDIEEVAEVRKFAIAGSLLAVMGILLVALSGVLWADVAGTVFALVGIFLFASGLIWSRSSVVRDFKEKLSASRDRFHSRLETETSAICDDLFFDVRHALTESIFRLDLRSAQVDAPLAETFRIGEAADEMVLRSQNFAARIAA